MFGESSKAFNPLALILLAALACGAYVWHQDVRDKEAAEYKTTTINHAVDRLSDSLRPAAWRTWSDDTGNYHTIGRLVGSDAANVQIEKQDSGTVVTVPKRRLRPAEVYYAEHGEHVVLPQDQRAWFTTVIGDPEVAKWFDTNTALNKLKGETRFNFYATADPMFTGRLASWLGPITKGVTLQDETGRVWFKQTDANLPADAETLRANLADCLAAWHRADGWAADNGNPCPDCRPRPTPAPTPTPCPTPTPVPDVGPPYVVPDSVAPAKSELSPLAVALVAGGVGLALALVHYGKQDVKSIFA